ncbi:MAG: hypothetical protein EXR67_04890 [Dehalococcoidia bacterium]|nr:hypothetical protein [Dehalococcoidia bacterium]
MNALERLSSLLHREGSPLVEVHPSDKSPLSVRVDSYEWSNPEVLKAGIKNPFILQFTVHLESAQPIIIESLIVDLGQDRITPLDFQPLTLSSPTSISPRFEIPFAAATRPLGPAVIVTANGVTTLTKRFRVHPVLT